MEVENDNMAEENIHQSDRDKLDWAKLKSLIHSQPKTLEQDAKLDENDIFNILVSYNGHEDLSKFLASMAISAFDTNQTGTIVWRQFMTDNMADMTEVELKTRKLKWIFRLLDRDGDGIIQLKEMIQTFGHFYIIEELDPRLIHIEKFCFLTICHSLCVERAELIFEMLDTDLDGEISEEEFIRGCLDDDELCRVLMNGLVKEEHPSYDKLPLRCSRTTERRQTTKRRYSELCKKEN